MPDDNDTADDAESALGEPPAAAPKPSKPRKPPPAGRGTLENPIAESQPLDLITFWPNLIAKERAERGIGPDRISISGSRIPIGVSERQEAIYLTPFDGQAVCGNGPPDYEGAGEDLVAFVTEVWHVRPGIETTARYRIRFNRKAVKDNYIGTCEIVLGPASQIKAMRGALAGMRAQREDAEPREVRESREPLPSRGYERPRGTMPGYSTTAYPESQPAQQEGSFSERSLLAQVNELRAREREWIEEARAARAEGRQPRLPDPERGSPEEEEARIARIVAQTLRGMGIAGTPAGIGAAPAVPSQPTPAQVDQVTQDPLDAMDRVLSAMDRLRAFDKRLGERYAPPAPPERDDPEPETPTVAAELVDDPFKMKEVPMVKYRGHDPILFRPKRDDEDWGKYLLELGMHNPTMAKDLASKVLSESELGNLLRKWAGMGLKAVETTGESVPQAAANGAPAWTPKA